MSECRFKCLSKNCSISSDDERMVSCWLCHGLCHFKCSGLKTLVCEALQNSRGLKWCCNECIKIDAEFYRFFQSTKNTFNSLQTKLSALSNEIAAYGNLFDDFKQLKNLKSPELSPKRRKSSRNKNKSSSEMVIQPEIVPVPLIEQAMSYSSVVKTTNIDLNHHEVPPVPDPTSSVKSASMDITHLEPFSSVQPNSITSDMATNIEDITTPKPLVVIPPKRHVFVSRLSYDTSVEDVQYYLNSKLGNVTDFTVYKFSYSQPRSITSFKITVPPHIYNQIVEPNFWPANIFVREYIFKENSRTRNVATLPPRDLSLPKN